MDHKRRRRLRSHERDRGRSSKKKPQSLSPQPRDGGRSSKKKTRAYRHSQEIEEDHQKKKIRTYRHSRVNEVKEEEKARARPRGHQKVTNEVEDREKFQIRSDLIAEVIRNRQSSY